MARLFDHIRGPARPMPMLVLATAVVVTIAGGARAQPKPGQEISLRFAGSSTVGEKAALELATAFAKRLKLPGVRVNGGLDPDEYEVVAEAAESTQRMRVQVQAKGTGTGIEPLLKGQTDFWMASRPAKESDLENMRKKGLPNVPTLAQFQQPGVENVIGLAALAVIVNARNPVPILNTTQIRDIYAAKVGTWSQIGGPADLAIASYSLTPSHGETDAFCGAIIGNANAQKCVESFQKLAAPPVPLPEDIAETVASTPGGVGFVGFAMKRSARAVPLGTVCGTGVEPTIFRIKAEEYPLVQRLYLYAMPGRLLTPAAKDFLQFALSPAGQAAVSAAGLADQSPGKADPNYASDRVDAVRDALDGGHTRIRAADVKAFETATAGAERLTITFRFQAGTNNLDSRAEADIGRLMALMQEPAYATAELSLIGFSAAAGDYAENRTLSQERANAVRDRLLAAGVRSVSAAGVGPAAAVACNLEPNAAGLNQRVEVWVRGGRNS